VNDGYELMKSEKQKFLDDCKTAGVEIYNTTAEEDQFYYDIAWQMADELMATTDIGDLGKQLIEAIKAPELAPGA
jgi:TRAP-type C4-dicarboxylate transport system substrate-binding protein